MEPAPHRQAVSPRDGLRALVELASADVAGQPERFLLPDSPREAAALAGVGAVRQDRRSRAASGPRTVLLVVVVVWAGAIVATIASGSAGAVWAVAFVGMSWAAARALWALLAASGSGPKVRGRTVALSREDSKRIARRAAHAFAGQLRLGDCDVEAAFRSYHQVLVALARFELAAGQAVAADQDLARLRPDDPLRPVAGQMAQDRAARAIAHRAAARAAADELQGR